MQLIGLVFAAVAVSVGLVGCADEPVAVGDGDGASSTGRLSGGGADVMTGETSNGSLGGSTQTDASASAETAMVAEETAEVADTEAESLGPDGFPAGCLETRPVDPAAQGRLNVRLEVQHEGGPFEFGEYNELVSGGTVLPTNLRFYLSQFALTSGGDVVPASLVRADGQALRYGVQLVNAEDPTSLQFDLAAPPGEYSGLSFILGLSHGCNEQFLPLKPPLDEASQMKWPHTLGFLFLRFEGNLSADVAADTPSMVHMGAAVGDDGFAPRFDLTVPLSVSEQGTPVELRFAFDAMLEAASMPTDLSDFELPPPSPPVIGEEILAGERLRRNVGLVELFTVSP